MATTYWIGNAPNFAGVEQAQVTAVANGATLTATINTKPITYTCTATDTITTATAAWFALLNNASTQPPEFSEETWTSPATDKIWATASTPGTPFAGMTGGLVFSAAGGATVVQTTITTSSSQSDVTNPKNWLRAGANAIPVNDDDVIVANSSVPLLWNLSGLAAVRFTTYRRWQDFTGTIGLPENNPNGYVEYRPTYFQFIGGTGVNTTMPVTLGDAQGQGGGPSRERYDFGAQRTAVTVLASGSPADDFAIRCLGTHASNTYSIVGTSVAVGMLPGEVSTIASASVDGGGSLALGSGVTFSGALTATGGSLYVQCAPASITVNGTSVTVTSAALTYTAITAINGSTLTWLSSSSITTLSLKTSSILDLSNSVRPITITNSSMDGDSCQVLDPNNSIVFTNATTINNTVSSGPITFGAGRTLKVT